jgi:PAS domain S-box-containing protein
VRAGMQSRSADKKSSPRRLHSLIVGTALIVAVIAGANAVVIAQLHQSTLHEVQTNLLRQSLTLSELAERSFQAVDLVLTSVADKVRLAAAADGDLHQLTNRDYRTFLKEKKAVLPQIDGIGILDVNGIRLNQTRDTPNPNTDLSHREYFTTLKANPKIASFIGDPIRSTLSGAWVIMMSRPVLADDGTLLGVVFASTDMEYFEDLFRSTSLGDGYAATLLKHDGTLLARYPRVGKIGATIPTTFVAMLSRSRSAVARSTSPIDGKERVAAAYSLSNYPLAVVVAQDEVSAFAAWRTAAVTLCLIAATMIGIVIAAAYLIARSWKQQERLNAARAEIIESEKVRALAEAELHRQRDLAEQTVRFTAAVENMSHGLCMFDTDQRLVVGNQPFIDMYRLPPELSKPGTSFRDIIAYRFRNSPPKGIQAGSALEEQLGVLSSLSADTRSSRIDEHDDGRLIRVTRQPLDVGGWVATHEDITEQRRAEQELDETKRFLDSIIENIPIAVIVKDVTTRKYVLVNRAFQAMLGLRREDLLGKTVFDFYNRKTAEFIDNVDNEFLRDCSGVQYSEYEVDSRLDGPQIHATSRIVTRDNQGEPKYFITVIEDVTERKKSERFTTR